MPQTHDLQPEGSRRLTDGLVRTIRRIAEERAAPLETSLCPFASGGRRLEVKIGRWTMSIFPGADEVISGFRTLDEEPVSEEWFRDQAPALMQRGFPWAAPLKFDWDQSARGMKALWQHWYGPVRMPTRLVVLYGDHGAVSDLSFFARRVASAREPAWTIQRGEAERLVLDPRPDYELDGDPELYMSGDRTAWSVRFRLKPGLWNKPVGGAESVDATTGELFGARIVGLIGRPVRRIDATPASNGDHLSPG